MTKKDIRKELSKKRNMLSEDEIAELSKNILVKLLSINVISSEKKVFAFISTKSEVSTDELISYCFDKGISVSVPRVYGDTMKFHRISSFEDLSKGTFGIFEPDSDLPVIVPDSDSVILMPGLAFDLYGGRIGYGGGYYDKYFEKKNQGLKIAVCFDFQVLKDKRIPVEESDIKPDMIITDKNIYGGIYE